MQCTAVVLVRHGISLWQRDVPWNTVYLLSYANCFCIVLYQQVNVQLTETVSLFEDHWLFLQKWFWHSVIDLTLTTETILNATLFTCRMKTQPTAGATCRKMTTLSFSTNSHLLAFSTIFCLQLRTMVTTYYVIVLFRWFIFFVFCLSLTFVCNFRRLSFIIMSVLGIKLPED